MIDIVTISGSPSLHSKSARVIDYVTDYATAKGFQTAAIKIRELPAEDLLFARVASPLIQASINQLREASAVIVATPIYKAAYSGLLKTYLDLLPQDILNGKIVLPIATGGSPAHMLAIDYALKPVLGAVGATNILNGIYVLDNQVEILPQGNYTLAKEIEARLLHTLQKLTEVLPDKSGSPLWALQKVS